MKKLMLQDKECVSCGGVFSRESCKRVSDFKAKKYCSRQCYFKDNTGVNHWFWKGGVKTRPDGYIRDSKTDKYIHRIVMENYLGRELLNTEHIHHIDGNPKNNNIDNLMVLSNSEHRKLESQIAKRNNTGQYAKK
jgi:hypothetical protein